MTDRVETALNSEFGSRVEILRAGEEVSIGARGSYDERAWEAHVLGQDLLQRTRADVLIWGTAASTDHYVDLRFISKIADAYGDTRQNTYLLNPTLHLSADFERDMGAIIAGVALAAAIPAENQSHYLVSALKPIEQRLAALSASGVAASTSDYARILSAYASVSYAIGTQSGDPSELSKAIGLIQRTLGYLDRKGDPLQWAAAEHTLADAISTLAELENDTKRLEESINIYHESLMERTRQKVPLQWALTTNNLGVALKSLGERTNNAPRLVEAIAAYHDALAVRTRTRVPLLWANTQNNLGNALVSLSRLEKNNKYLDDAISAFRAALSENTRERAPLRWAAILNNLGNAFDALGETTNNREALRSAIDCYHQALLERTRVRVPLDWAMTQNGLGNALKNLGALDGDVVSLRSAVVAYQSALKEWTREKTPYYYDGVSQNLARAEQILAKHLKNTP